MNNIQIILAESGSVATLKKDFPVYQGAFQNKLLNVFVPTSVLGSNIKSQFVGADGTVRAEEGAYTAVKIGVVYIQTTGKLAQSPTYYMRYINTVTLNGVEYYQYERSMPKDFTLFAGEGANAPKLIINVVNLANSITYETGSTGEITKTTNNATILSVITSQRCDMDVMPSTDLDQEPTVDPTDLELITGQINDLSLKLESKSARNETMLYYNPAQTLPPYINYYKDGYKTPYVHFTGVTFDNIPEAYNDDGTVAMFGTYTGYVVVSNVETSGNIVTATEIFTCESGIFIRQIKYNISSGDPTKYTVLYVGDWDSSDWVINTQLRDQILQNKESIRNTNVTVVDLENRVETAETTVASFDTRVSAVENDITGIDSQIQNILDNLVFGEYPVGNMTVQTLPTTEELDAYVLETTGRATRLGDTVYVLLDVTTGADTLYKYIFSVKSHEGEVYEGEWRSIIVPNVGAANNGETGLVQGTLDSNHLDKLMAGTIKAIADIQNGEITDIVIKYNNGAKSLYEINRELYQLYAQVQTTVFEHTRDISQIQTTLTTVTDTDIPALQAKDTSLQTQIDTINNTGLKNVVYYRDNDPELTAIKAREIYGYTMAGLGIPEEDNQLYNSVKLGIIDYMAVNFYNQINHLTENHVPGGAVTGGKITQNNQIINYGDPLLVDEDLGRDKYKLRRYGYYGSLKYDYYAMGSDVGDVTTLTAGSNVVESLNLVQVALTNLNTELETITADIEKNTADITANKADAVSKATNTQPLMYSDSFAVDTTGALKHTENLWDIRTGTTSTTEHVAIPVTNDAARLFLVQEQETLIDLVNWKASFNDAGLNYIADLSNVPEGETSSPAVQTYLTDLYHTVSGTPAEQLPLDQTTLNDETLGKTYKYYLNTKEWVLSKGSGVSQATNNLYNSSGVLVTSGSPGYIVGSNLNFHAFVETNGELAINGLDALQTAVTNNTSAIATETQARQEAVSNLENRVIEDEKLIAEKMSYKGAFSPAVVYDQYDLVTYNNSTFISKVGSNGGHTPPAYPSGENTYWKNITVTSQAVSTDSMGQQTYNIIGTNEGNSSARLKQALNAKIQVTSSGTYLQDSRGMVAAQSDIEAIDEVLLTKAEKKSGATGNGTSQFVNNGDGTIEGESGQYALRAQLPTSVEELGGILPLAHGGTGNGRYNEGVVYFSGNENLGFDTILTGRAGQVLTSQGAQMRPLWQDLPAPKSLYVHNLVFKCSCKTEDDNSANCFVSAIIINNISSPITTETQIINNIFNPNNLNDIIHAQGLISTSTGSTKYVLLGINATATSVLNIVYITNKYQAVYTYSQAMSVTNIMDTVRSV